MNFLVELFDVHAVRKPGKTCGQIEESQSQLPFPMERIDENNVPRNWHKKIIHNVGVFQVNDAVLDVVT